MKKEIDSSDYITIIGALEKITAKLPMIEMKLRTGVDVREERKLYHELLLLATHAQIAYKAILKY